MASGVSKRDDQSKQEEQGQSWRTRRYDRLHQGRSRAINTVVHRPSSKSIQSPTPLSGWPLFRWQRAFGSRHETSSPTTDPTRFSGIRTTTNRKRFGWKIQIIRHSEFLIGTIPKGADVRFRYPIHKPESIPRSRRPPAIQISLIGLYRQGLWLL